VYRGLEVVRVTIQLIPNQFQGIDSARLRKYLDQIETFLYIQLR
jgi:hypothetical protein